MFTGAIKVLASDQMQAADKYTIETFGIPGVVLMENAGRATVTAMMEYFHWHDPIVAAVFCGKGNNGGDGYVIARHLHNLGHQVAIFSLANLNDLKGDALINAQIAVNMGLEIIELPEEESASQMPFNPGDFDVVVDALFGTGLYKAVQGHYVHAIDAINNSGLPVTAVDIPSGLSADTGELLGPTVQADLTVTFAYPKIGIIIPPAAEYAGQVIVSDISIPDMVEQSDWVMSLVTEEMVEQFIPLRAPGSHKGTYGHGLVIAGSPGKCGAAAMVGAAALRVGAGLVTNAVESSLVHTLDAMQLETMTLPISGRDGLFTSESLPLLLEETKDKNAVAIGPGIGTAKDTVEFVHRFVEAVEDPTILDADAVNAYAGNLDKLKSDKTELVITPHPGEMGRLLGMSTEEVQRFRTEMACELAMNNKIIVVLKGHRTVIAEPGGHIFINMTGNAGMATAGSGDVLTGMIMGLVANSEIKTLEAVLLAVHLHGLAGDIAADALGQYSVNATDILDSIPSAFKSFEETEEE